MTIITKVRVKTNEKKREIKQWLLQDMTQ